MTRSISRRLLIGSFAGAGVAAWAAARWAAARWAAGEEPALVNHVGFPPASAKWCLTPGTRPTDFSVAQRTGGKVVTTGTLQPVKGDLGSYLAGDFSGLADPGEYELRVAGARPRPFAVNDRIYDPIIQQCIDYFSVQRCGDSGSGYNAPCHLDDGRRSDNGAHQTITGGWHDACDVRKWVNATIHGMLGLSRVLDVLGPGRVPREKVIAELRWGNRYFRGMQEPAGYVMNHCGGDEGNNFTDNTIGTGDDRLIHVEACEVPAQFHFVCAQAAMVRHLREDDPAEARACAEAAERCLNWCITSRKPRTAISLAAGAMACVALHRATRRDNLRTQAAAYARDLLALQEMGDAGGGQAVRGFFRAHPDRPDPLRDIMHGNLSLLALCELLETFGDDPGAGAWRAALRAHADHLLRMSERSAFGIVPFGLYAGSDPGGDRRIGRYWYRYFMKRRGEYDAADWWVGINAHLTSHGVGLIRAARVLDDARLAHLAQRQLDWILGVNPFDASTITGAGRNQPKLYVTGAFRPATPLIAGGVMNGIGGSDHDEPRLDSGSYHTCEYWTPMVAYTMWLLAELQLPPKA